MDIKTVDTNATTWGIYVDGGLRLQIAPNLYDSKDTAKKAYERVYGIGRVTVN